MEIMIYLLLVILLVTLNGFFTTAEFATVKIRPTQMEALIANGDKRAEAGKYIQKHIEEFLSVCWRACFCRNCKCNIGKVFRT